MKNQTKFECYLQYIKRLKNFELRKSRILLLAKYMIVLRNLVKTTL